MANVDDPDAARKDADSISHNGKRVNQIYYDLSEDLGGYTSDLTRP